MTHHPSPDWESLAVEPLDTDDATLMRRIAYLCDAADPVPRHLPDEVIFGISRQAMRADLAELVTRPDVAITAQRRGQEQWPSARTESPQS